MPFLHGLRGDEAVTPGLV